MAEFVACLEDDDRQADIIGENWGYLWRRLNRSGEPPDPAPLLEMLFNAALIQADPVTGTDDAQRIVAVMLYRVHPGVAAAIRAVAPPETRDTVDAQLAEYWRVVSARSQQREGGENSVAVRRVGLAGTPYLLRRQGEHNAEVLAELGFSAAEIAALEASGALVQPSRNTTAGSAPDPRFAPDADDGALASDPGGGAAGPGTRSASSPRAR